MKIAWHSSLTDARELAAESAMRAAISRAGHTLSPDADSHVIVVGGKTPEVEGVGPKLALVFDVTPLSLASLQGYNYVLFPSPDYLTTWKGCPANWYAPVFDAADWVPPASSLRNPCFHYVSLVPESGADTVAPLLKLFWTRYSDRDPVHLTIRFLGNADLLYPAIREAESQTSRDNRAVVSIVGGPWTADVFKLSALADVFLPLSGALAIEAMVAMRSGAYVVGSSRTCGSFLDAGVGTVVPPGKSSALDWSVVDSAMGIAYAAGRRFLYPAAKAAAGHTVGTSDFPARVVRGLASFRKA